METDEASDRLRFRRLAIAASLVVLGYSIGLGWHAQHSFPVLKIPLAIVEENKTSGITKTATAATTTARIYLLSLQNNKLVLVAQAVSLTDASTPTVSLRIAFEQLLATSRPASQPPGLVSTIPTGTKLLDLKVQSGNVYVDLSAEFAHGGGSTSMIGRVGQVVYTATSLNDQAKVFISVTGQPIGDQHPLGGEGLILRQPTTRQEFITDFAG